MSDKDKAKAPDTAEDAGDEKKKKGSKKPLLFGLLAALILGGGATYATMNGIVSVPFMGKSDKKDKSDDYDNHADTKDMRDHDKEYAYVPIDDLFVSIVKQGRPKQLRMSLNIETDKEHLEKVEKAMPRIKDMLNTYLRAVEEQDLVDPSALDRLRAQILRRLHLVLPPEAVSDLLVTNFIIT